ncbi:MAG: phosphotransferase [Burkholderiales bacterium]|nr:phosphotransferase [Burkholderiales bacterium]
MQTRFPPGSFALAPASADASFRRYFRVTFPGTSRASVIAMDAPPDKEDSRPFVHVARLMAAAGLNVPAILAADLGEGFLLLSDLGTTPYLAALDEGSADRLFRDALAALVKWQLATAPGALPPYDAALLRRELDLFPEWYLGRHLGLALGAAERDMLERTFALLIASATAQPQVFVHRDFMPRNLMVCDPNPGVLDFQDAVVGPISYDVVSLFRDAFLSWPEARVLDWTIRYWESARRAGLPVAADFADFWRDFEWMGLQRHLKVLGIFARIRYRDGKTGYLEDTPRFVGYVREVASRYAALAPLLRFFDAIEGRAARAGYTF